MDSKELFRNYQELQAYVGWDEEDGRRVRASQPIVKPHFPALIDDFYAEIDRHPTARKVITGGPEQIERLKRSLLIWLDELFSGRYDATYVARRWKVGQRHVEIGLSQVFTNVALSRLRTGLFRTLDAGWTGDLSERAQTHRSLNKLLDLDLAIIEDAYQSEHLKRQQVSERLATIGQISGGVAHELRNPLNVIKTSVYYLVNAKNPTPEKTAEHLARIQRQVDVADGVTTALSDFAKMPVPQLRPFSLAACLADALETASLPAKIHVSIDCLDDLPPVLGDQRQLTIVFGNLIRNARDAMPEGGDLTIRASQRGASVEIAVADTGIGIREEDLDRILEPLFSTKARGIGLGLAITRAILDKHKAELSVKSQLGLGSTFTVRLAAQLGDLDS
jgi:signal transduction histidine kinase